MTTKELLAIGAGTTSGYIFAELMKFIWRLIWN